MKYKLERVIKNAVERKVRKKTIQNYSSYDPKVLYSPHKVATAVRRKILTTL